MLTIPCFIFVKEKGMSMYNKLRFEACAVINYCGRANDREINCYLKRWGTGLCRVR
jgi:hypothetical protein